MFPPYRKVLQEPCFPQVNIQLLPELFLHTVFISLLLFDPLHSLTSIFTIWYRCSYQQSSLLAHLSETSHFFQWPNSLHSFDKVHYLFFLETSASIDAIMFPFPIYNCLLFPIFFLSSSFPPIFWMIVSPSHISQRITYSSKCIILMGNAIHPVVLIFT